MNCSTKHDASWPQLKYRRALAGIEYNVLIVRLSAPRRSRLRAVKQFEPHALSPRDFRGIRSYPLKAKSSQDISQYVRILEKLSFSKLRLCANHWALKNCECIGKCHTPTEAEKYLGFETVNELQPKLRAIPLINFLHTLCQALSGFCP